MATLFERSPKDITSRKTTKHARPPQQHPQLPLPSQSPLLPCLVGHSRSPQGHHLLLSPGGRSLISPLCHARARTNRGRDLPNEGKRCELRRGRAKDSCDRNARAPERHGERVPREALSSRGHVRAARRAAHLSLGGLQQRWEAFLDKREVRRSQIGGECESEGECSRPQSSKE